MNTILTDFRTIWSNRRSPNCVIGFEEKWKESELPFCKTGSIWLINILLSLLWDWRSTFLWLAVYGLSCYWYKNGCNDTGQLRINRSIYTEEHACKWVQLIDLDPFMIDILSLLKSWIERMIWNFIRKAYSLRITKVIHSVIIEQITNNNI